MTYLLDTCAISEVMVRSPNPHVIAYLNSVALSDSYVSTISVGEIHQGIERLPRSRRRNTLEEWFEKAVLIPYQNQLLPVDEAVALRWGRLQAELSRNGTPIEAEDSLIAATALTHGLTVITRNERDFQRCGILIANPWK